MPTQTEGAVTDVTAETLAVEEVALSAQSLHHIHSLGAEVADVAAAEAGREVLTYHTLRGRRAGLQNQFTYMLSTAFKSLLLIISKRYLQ